MVKEKELNLVASNYKTIYPELLKRLDDSQDRLRVMGGSCLKTWVKSVKTWMARVKDIQTEAYMEKTLDNVHFEAIVQGCAIHMDDLNETVQESMFQVLQEVKDVCPGVLREHLSSIRSKHRSTRYIDALLGGI